MALNRIVHEYWHLIIFHCTCKIVSKFSLCLNSSKPVDPVRPKRARLPLSVTFEWRACLWLSNASATCYDSIAKANVNLINATLAQRRFHAVNQMLEIALPFQSRFEHFKYWKMHPANLYNSTFKMLIKLGTQFVKFSSFCQEKPKKFSFNRHDISNVLYRGDRGKARKTGEPWNALWTLR